MNSFRSLLLLGLFSLLMAWWLWPESKTAGNSSIEIPATLALEIQAPVSAASLSAAIPLSRKTVELPQQKQKLSASSPTTVSPPTGILFGHIVDTFGNTLNQGAVLVFCKQQQVKRITLDPKTLEYHVQLPAGKSYGLVVDPSSLSGGWIPPLAHSRKSTYSETKNDPLRLSFFAKQQVPLTAGGNKRLDLQVGLPARAFGRVLDAEGFPVAEVLVRMQSLDRDNGSLVESATTDSRGIFSFPEIYPGHHRLLLFPSPNALSINSNWTPPSPQDKTLAAGQIQDFGDLILEGGQQSIHGRIVNQEDESFPGLHLLCFSNQPVEKGLDPHTFSSALAETTTDAQGFFSFSNLPADPVQISLTPDFCPGQAMGEGHPAIWEPNIKVDLSQNPGTVDLGIYTVEESRAFLLAGNFVFDSQWLSTDGHQRQDLQIILSQVAGESLPKDVRRNPIQKQRIPIDFNSGHFEYAVETPMTTLQLRIQLAGYADLTFRVHPEPLQKISREIQVPSDFMR